MESEPMAEDYPLHETPSARAGASGLRRVKTTCSLAYLLGMSERWRGREAELFAVAFGVAVTVAAAVPASIFVRSGAGALTLLVLVRVVGRNPRVLTRFVGGVTGWRAPVRARIALVGVTVLAMVALMLLRAAPVAVAVAVLVAMTVGLVELASRDRLGVLGWRAWHWILLRLSIDALSAVALTAAVATTEQGFLRSSPAGWVLVGALAAVVVRLRFFTIGDVPIGPAYTHERATRLVDERIGRAAMMEAVRWIASVLADGLPEVPVSRLAAGITAALTSRRDDVTPAHQLMTVAHVRSTADDTSKDERFRKQALLAFAVQELGLRQTSRLLEQLRERPRAALQL